VTAKKDSFIVLHMSANGDVILDLGQSAVRDGEKISELVGVLLQEASAEGRILAVNVFDTTISAQTANNKSINAKTTVGATQPDGSAIFKSSRTDLTAQYAEL
jgi:hypothetical protein